MSSSSSPSNHPDQIHAFCPRCRHRQPFIRCEINHWGYFLFSILTFGLFLVCWVAACIGKRMYPWRCEHCGWQKPQFHQSDKPEDHVQRLIRPYKSGVPGRTAMELKNRAEVYRQSCDQH